ncbi:PepSY domain-containing protein [Lysobacter koreensis]|uniref:PepSY domain-containing protein n=1 Tax=Lysobacter koreensis TaxID=266122 RepID=A0ABW2YLW7_9GAMM
MTLPTFRNAMFQLHWFFGITAGVVLALVGATGAMLSFEHELLKALNPGVITVAAQSQALAPDALVARIRAQQPEAKLQSLALSADPNEAAKAGFAPKADAPKGPGGRARGESRYVDPYTGTLLAKPRGEGFFRTTMQLHRWLVMDDVGKQIVGASTVILVFFCLSGLYLRWPRRWGSVRVWLALDWRQKGRNFLWHLHSIVGTWVLVLYLVMALTGLWWSYDWYRDGLNRWAGVPSQQSQKKEPPAGERGKGRDGADREERKADDAAVLDVGAAWVAFEDAAPAWSTATLQWPRDGGGAQFAYLDVDAPHERARNTIELDAATLAVTKHERYDAKPTRQKIVGSMFALHRGSFFGTAGVLAFMLASLLMPLFAITGWMLYLDRRRKQHAARALATAQAALPAASGGEPLLLAYASQTGSAQRLAWQTAAALREGGFDVRVERLGRLRPEQLANAGRALFVVSTFGEGQPPDDARGFARRMRAQSLSLATLQYGVLALGDREYDSYCEFGRELDHWLHHAGAQPLFDRIDVDAGDAGALRHWQHHIGQLAGRTDLPDWSAPSYGAWHLIQREWLNIGSPGGRAYHLALTPHDPADLAWQAGDIAEIGPRHDDASVDAWLAAAGFDGDSDVVQADTPLPLRTVLARSRLPDPSTARGLPPQQLAATLAPLPHREYSIASLPADGSLQLLVRRMRHPDGRLGSGSGWLTEHAALGNDIALRIRPNPSFHPPADARPLILVGNGTGLAGLRAVLKARIAAGHTRNWMLFGERSGLHDFHYRDEIERWQREGQVQHLDLAFSRDHAPRRYVQHLLQEQRARLDEWLAAGAAVYVCGSLEGMAPGVDAVLREVVGVDALEAMAEDGRYRRDVY